MDPDELRAVQRTQWAAAAPGWDRHAALVDEQGAPVTEVLLRRAAPAPGERVLEVACGPGGVGLVAATLVGSEGAVVLTDVAEEMTAIAARRAAALRLPQVEVRPADAEALDEPDGAFDVVVSRMGLMLVPDPARAAAELARVLRPGGRAAVAVWGPREANPWLAVLLDAVGAELGVEVPPPGVPGPFSLADAGRLADLLRDAGLEAVAVDEVEPPFRAASAEAWWAVVPSLAGPLAQLLDALPPPTAQAIHDRAVDAISAFATPGGEVVATGRALVASGTRAG